MSEILSRIDEIEERLAAGEKFIEDTNQGVGYTMHTVDCGIISLTNYFSDIRYLLTRIAELEAAITILKNVIFRWRVDCNEMEMNLPVHFEREEWEKIVGILEAYDGKY